MRYTIMQKSTIQDNSSCLIRELLPAEILAGEFHPEIERHTKASSPIAASKRIVFFISTSLVELENLREGMFDQACFGQYGKFQAAILCDIETDILFRENFPERFEIKISIA